MKYYHGLNQLILFLVVNVKFVVISQSKNQVNGVIRHFTHSTLDFTSN